MVIKMEEKIKKIIDEIRPYLNSDGGDIEFIKYANKYVYVKLLGGCAHCAHRNETIKFGIFEAIKEKYPEVEGIINVEL